MGRQLPYGVSQVSTYAWAPVKTSGDDRGRRGCSENVREKTKLLLPLCRVRLVPARSGRMGYGSPLGTTMPLENGPCSDTRGNAVPEGHGRWCQSSTDAPSPMRDPSRSRRCPARPCRALDGWLTLRSGWTWCAGSRRWW